MQCGEWNTIQEEVPLYTSAGPGRAGGEGRVLKPQKPETSASSREERLGSGFKDIDTVLGGGFVSGGVVLLAGQPGIGKSTLLMQVAALAAKKADVLYVSGEESEHQVGMRAVRLAAQTSSLSIVSSNTADDIAATIRTKQYRLVIVDSIQTVVTAGVASASGSVSQITNSTHTLLQAAKAANVALIIVGHVTKDGTIAGPKLLEHIVDVVIQLEGDAFGGYKVLRAVKNRFGPTSETAIMEMDELGLRPVENPSAALLAERQMCDGSVVLATLEGSRPLLVEVQALVNKTSYGYPKRAASGFDLNRMNLLVAVLERRTKLSLSDYDIYLNIVGGIRVADPAADLAVCLAIASAARGMQLSRNVAVFGEVGLSGELRHAAFPEKRVKEALKLGMDGAVGPNMRGSRRKITGLYGLSDVRTALNTYLKAA